MIKKMNKKVANGIALEIALLTAFFRCFVVDVNSKRKQSFFSFANGLNSSRELLHSLLKRAHSFHMKSFRYT